MTTKHENIERGALSPAAAAEYLGVSRATVHARIKDGSIPSVKLGPRLRLIRKDDLDAILRGEQPAGGGAA